MSLFSIKKFTSHSGKELNWKIDCDYLTNEELDTLAWLISNKYKNCEVQGIPTGGLKLAEALKRYLPESEIQRTQGGNPRSILIVDDVMTTGKSFSAFREELIFTRKLVVNSARYNCTFFTGVVLFSRCKRPNWVLPVFQLNPVWAD